MFCLMTVSGAFAYSSYLTAFNSKYGTSGTVLNTCGICHINPAGGGSRNPYGTSFAGVSTHSSNPSGAYTTIEPLDSDGDGYSNITEINARTFPGDATSHPSSGICRHHCSNSDGLHGTNDISHSRDSDNNNYGNG